MESRNKILDDMLLCKICCEYYNMTDRKPLILPCGHTFCKDTISQLINKKQRGAIECPNCKQITPCLVSDNIPVNFDLLPMVEERNRPVA